MYAERSLCIGCEIGTRGCAIAGVAAAGQVVIADTGAVAQPWLAVDTTRLPFFLSFMASDPPPAPPSRAVVGADGHWTALPPTGPSPTCAHWPALPVQSPDRAGASPMASAMTSRLACIKRSTVLGCPLRPHPHMQPQPSPDAPAPDSPRAVTAQPQPAQPMLPSPPSDKSPDPMRLRGGCVPCPVSLLAAPAPTPPLTSPRCIAGWQFLLDHPHPLLLLLITSAPHRLFPPCLHFHLLTLFASYVLFSLGPIHLL